ncbi:MAG: FG-GAP-like repeat-containing protein [Acidobacteriia bacterium]|nr:FG-GAP-like repeat-containing protein [Terriglobia bacterium]
MNGTTPVAFSYTIGGTIPASQTVTVTTTPGGLAVTATPQVTTPAQGHWLSASLSGGTLTISVNPSGLAASPTAYTGNAKLSAPGTSDVSIPVTLLVHPPAALSIAKTHAGNFTAGQAGATYTVNVSNGAAAGSTSGTVTVTETVPSGLALVSMAGTGWTCPASGTTCTRSDVLAPGSSYPAITVTVNVAANAPSQVTNQVSVSGGGSASLSASDVTNITNITSRVAGDFDGDGHLDLVWQNDATRELTVWNLGGTQGATFLGWHPLNGSVPGWRVVGIADFDGDGHPDLVWQNDTTRQTTVWYMGGTQGSTFLNWNYLSGSVAGWKVVGVADLNGDGHPDLIWQDDVTRTVTVWYMGGTQGATFLGWNYLSGTVAGWRVVGAGDFNGDGHLDLVWQNDATRELTVWYMGGAQGATFLDWSPLSGGVAGWKVVGTADFNRDGKPDLIWQNDTTRETTVWYMGGTRGTTFLGWNFLSGNVAGWNVVGPR